MKKITVYSGIIKVIFLILELIFLIFSASIFLNLIGSIRSKMVLRFLSFYSPLLIYVLFRATTRELDNPELKGHVVFLPYFLALTLGYYYFNKKANKVIKTPNNRIQ